MAKVITTYPDKKGLVWSVQLQLGKLSSKEWTIFERPVNKLVLLVENEKCYLNVQDISILMGGVCRWHMLRFDTSWEEGMPFLPISKLFGTVSSDVIRNIFTK